MQHLDIVYEDENLLVVNKPQPMHSVSQDKNRPEQALSDLLEAYWAGKNTISVNPDFQGGLVSRLDQLTSGAMLSLRSLAKVPRKEFDLDRLQIKKYYLALTASDLSKKYWESSFDAKTQIETIQSCFRAYGPGRKTVKACHASGPGSKHSGMKTYVTQIMRVHEENGITAYLCRIDSGFRHQIRVHLSSTGRPILGDPLYNSLPDNRLRLHSLAVHFIHPATGETKTVYASPDNDFWAGLKTDFRSLTLEKSRGLINTWL